MDMDIAKELSRLQEKKLALEVGTDLSDKCDTIIELDRRVGLLSNAVRLLRAEVDPGIDDICEKLDHPATVLRRTELILELINGLSRLNGLCRQIDTNPNLIHSTDANTVSLNLKRINNTSNDDENCDENSNIKQLLEIIEEFESNYKPIEEILSKRPDLPYLNYATKVISLKKSCEQLKHNQAQLLTK